MLCFNDSQPNYFYPNSISSFYLGMFTKYSFNARPMIRNHILHFICDLRLVNIKNDNKVIIIIITLLNQM